MPRLSNKLTALQKKLLDKMAVNPPTPRSVGDPTATRLGTIRGDADFNEPVSYPLHYRPFDPDTETYRTPCQKSSVPPTPYYCGSEAPVPIAGIVPSGSIWHKSDTGTVFRFDDGIWTLLDPQPIARLVIAGGPWGNLITGIVVRNHNQDEDDFPLTKKPKPPFTFRQLVEKAKGKH